MQKRVEYIDRLKGFAILLVIIGHTTLWVLQQDGNNPIVSLVASFHMPLFMFLSGIVISTPPNITKCIRKIVQFWMPLLTIGIVYTISIKGSLIGYAFNNMKYGYWYLYTLGFLYLLLIPFRYNIYNKRFIQIIIDIITFSIIYIILILCNKVIPTNLRGLLSMDQTVNYWQWFFLGYFFRKYNGIEILSKHNWIFSICLIACIPLYYLSQNNIRHLYRIVAFCAIIVCVYIFKERSHKHSIIENELTKIGRVSLDVYIYHYFFVFPLGSLNFRHLGEWFINTNNYFLEFIFVALLSIVTAYLAMTIGYIIKQSTILEQLVYGKFLNKFIK